MMRHTYLKFILDVLSFILYKGLRKQPNRPQSKLCHRGFVYKLIPESTRTFTFYKPVKDYIMGILDRTEVSPVL